MSSIGSTLNSINQSLLSEISSDLAASKTSTASTQSTSSTTTTASSDSVNFSQVGQLFQQLQQLQASDPADLKTVLTDAASKFKTAAQQATDPSQATFLNNLSAKFQNAADTGDLSALKPQSSPGSGSTYGPHGHHHHHHQDSGGDSSATQSSSSTSGASSTQDLLASLLGTAQSSAASSSTNPLSLIASLFGENS